jgi:hypothetical protein
MGRLRVVVANEGTTRSGRREGSKRLLFLNKKKQKDFV